MTKITNILVPVDFSEPSRKAMRYGAGIALKFGAKLTAVHIVPSFAAFNYAFPGDTYEFERKVFAEARRMLPLEIPEAYRERLNTQAVVKSGDVRDELLRIVESEKVDLVVMGTHGRRHFERFFLGSTAESLLRRVSTPLLTVSQPAMEREAQSPFDAPFRRIVYATDFSEAAASGLRYCCDLAHHLGAGINVLHVMELQDNAALGDESEVREKLLTRLQEMIQRETAAGLQITAEVVRGTPYREILRFAEEHSSDLLAINLQSKGLLERALLGATAERVIRSAAIPVLGIPALDVKCRMSNVQRPIHLSNDPLFNPVGYFGDKPGQNPNSLRGKFLRIANMLSAKGIGGLSPKYRLDSW